MKGLPQEKREYRVVWQRKGASPRNRIYSALYWARKHVNRLQTLDPHHFCDHQMYGDEQCLEPIERIRIEERTVAPWSAIPGPWDARTCKCGHFHYASPGDDGADSGCQDDECSCDDWEAAA